MCPRPTSRTASVVHHGLVLLFGTRWDLSGTLQGPDFHLYLAPLDPQATDSARLPHHRLLQHFFAFSSVRSDGRVARRSTGFVSSQKGMLMPRINDTTNRQTAFLRAFLTEPSGPPAHEWPTPARIRVWLRRD